MNPKPRNARISKELLLLAVDRQIEWAKKHFITKDVLENVVSNVIYHLSLMLIKCFRILFLSLSMKLIIYHLLAGCQNQKRIINKKRQ